MRLYARLHSRMFYAACCQCRYADGLLDAVAGLAHRLDAAGLLSKIETYLRGECSTFQGFQAGAAML